MYSNLHLVAWPVTYEFFSNVKKNMTIIIIKTAENNMVKINTIKIYYQTPEVISILNYTL